MSNLLLQELNQRPIAFYPLYKNLTGSLAGGLLLSQLMYWFAKQDKFYKTDVEIMSETTLSENELRAAKIKLKKLDFISITKEGIPAKTYYKIDWKKYADTLSNAVNTIVSLNSRNKNGEIHETRMGKFTKQEWGNSRNKNGEIHEAINDISLTETTTETTTEILSPKPSLKPKKEEERSFDKSLFLKFIEDTRKVYKGNGDRNWFPTLFDYQDNQIGVNSNGHLYVKGTGETLQPSEAQNLWEYIFKHKEQIVSIEHQIENHRQKIIQELRSKTLSQGDQAS